MEHDWLLLAEAYSWTHTEVLKMPCSRRHKAVKFREEIARRREAGRGHSGGVTTPATWYQAAQQSQQYKTGSGNG